MAINAPDETANRARLANVATFGAAGQNMPTEAPDPRQGAIDAALARGQQIGATAPVQDQVAGRIGNVYDTGYQGLSSIRGANAGAVGGINNATDEYLRQLDLAKPIEEGRNKVAIQQILADKARGDKDTSFRDKQFAFDQKKFDESVRQWNIEHPGDSGAGAIDLSGAGKALGYSPSQTQAILSDPNYHAANQLIGQAKTDLKYDYDQIKGLIHSWTQTDPATAPAGTPKISSDTEALLLKAYGPQFETAAQRANPMFDVNTATAGAPTSHVNITTTPAEDKKIASDTRTVHLQSAIEALTPKQRAILSQLASAHGMNSVDFLRQNPELIGEKSKGTLKPLPKV